MMTLDSTTFGFGSSLAGAHARLRCTPRGSAIQLTLTSWLRPSRTFIDALLRELPPVAQEMALER